MWIEGQFCVIAGPCVIEDEQLCFEIASNLKCICEKLGFTYIFKASFDKANRSSLSSPRGPGLIDGLRVLETVRSHFGIRVTTDIHEPWQAAQVASSIDLIQIPAFLCRQTDLIVAAGKTGLPVNIKKGQFMAPWDMSAAIEKAREAGARTVLVTERGTTFGYNQVVVDMRSLVYLKHLRQRVIFDASHSTQLGPRPLNDALTEAQFIAPLARAAVAVGIDGIFFETHPNPDRALSDGARSLPLSEVDSLLHTLAGIRDVVSSSN